MNYLWSRNLTTSVVSVVRVLDQVGKLMRFLYQTNRQETVDLSMPAGDKTMSVLSHFESMEILRLVCEIKTKWNWCISKHVQMEG